MDIFHDLLERKTCFEDLKRLLNSLDMNEMYIELHSCDKTQMEGACANLSPEEVVSLVLQNSCLNSYKLLGEYEEGRAIYKLWR